MTAPTREEKLDVVMRDLTYFAICEVVKMRSVRSVDRDRSRWQSGVLVVKRQKRPAREQVKEAIDRTGVTRREWARRFAWSESTMSSILNGKRLPTLGQAVQIERTFRVPARLWIVGE
jgi:gp16 family phage-associated protein